MSLRLRIGAAAVGTALAFGAATLPAHAADGALLQKAQKVVTDGVDKRLGTLNDLSTRLGGYKDLPSGDRATLSTLLNADISGLTALRAKVAGETTVEAVRADGKAISAATHDIQGAAKDARGDIVKAVADAKKVRDALKASTKK